MSDLFRLLTSQMRRMRAPGSILLAIEDVGDERTALDESKRNWKLTQSIVDTIRDPLVVLPSLSSTNRPSRTM